MKRSVRFIFYLGDSGITQPSAKVLLSTGAGSVERLPYQLSIVSSTLTMAVTGNGESGFDSGEGA